MDPQIIIVGPLKLQNELLTFFIGRSTGLRCVRRQEYSFSYISGIAKDELPLILWDCRGFDGSNLSLEYGKSFESMPEKCPGSFLTVPTRHMFPISMPNCCPRGLTGGDVMLVAAY